MPKIMLVTVAIWLLFLSSCDSYSVSKRGRIRLCGHLLTETLHMVCQGQYFDPEENSISKREAVPQFASDFSQDWFVGFPIPRIKQSNYHRRQLEGVANECCVHACTLSDLLAYCRN